MKGKSGLLVLLLGCGSATALAQGPVDPMDACAQMSDANARLACFDHEVQRRHAATAGAPAAPVQSPVSKAPSPAAAVSQTPADDTVGLDGRQLILRRKEEGIAPAAPPVRIVAVLARLRPRPGNQYYFDLDNGQVWETTDNEGVLLLGAHETVTIRPGMLGSFFLKTQEGNSVRVHRLK